jgi:hypothetical protein
MGSGVETSESSLSLELRFESMTTAERVHVNPTGVTTPLLLKTL